MRVFVDGQFADINPDEIDSICWNKTSATIETVDGKIFDLSYYNPGNRALLEAWTPNWQELSWYKSRLLPPYLIK